MKKAVVLSIIIITVFGCSKKVTPTTTSTTTPTETPMQVAVETNIASGKITYEAKCGRCHALPVTTNFDAKRWVGIVDWMAPKAKLTDEEKANVLAYVQANAKS